MLPLAIDTIGVFLLCFLSIKFLGQKIPASLIVVDWTFLGPFLMQLANYLHLGYLEPFWRWTSFVLVLIALVASMAALMISAAVEKIE